MKYVIWPPRLLLKLGQPNIELLEGIVQVC